MLHLAAAWKPPKLPKPDILLTGSAEIVAVGCCVLAHDLHLDMLHSAGQSGGMLQISVMYTCVSCVVCAVCAGAPLSLVNLTEVD